MVNERLTRDNRASWQDFWNRPPDITDAASGSAT